MSHMSAISPWETHIDCGNKHASFHLSLLDTTPATRFPRLQLLIFHSRSLSCEVEPANSVLALGHPAAIFLRKAIRAQLQPALDPRCEFIRNITLKYKCTFHSNWAPREKLHKSRESVWIPPKSNLKRGERPKEKPWGSTGTIDRGLNWELVLERGLLITPSLCSPSSR